MTATPPAPAPQAGQVRTLHLSELLKRPVTARDGESLGRLSDVVVRLRGSELPHGYWYGALFAIVLFDASIIGASAVTLSTTMRSVTCSG
jgi:hypothetical protein